MRSSALTVAPSALVTITPSTTTRVGVTGTLFENNDWSAGAKSDFSAHRLIVRHLTVVAAADGGVSFTSYDATFLTGGFLPGAELSFGGFSVAAGEHAAFGQTAVPDAAAIANVPWHANLRSGTHTSIAPAYRATLRFGGATREPAATLWARDDPQYIGGDHITNRTAGVAANAGRLAVSVSGGIRRARDERMEFADGSASFEITRTLSLEAAAGTYPSDRLTGAARGRYASFGVSARFGMRNDGQ
jgi:hypothetical protein